MPKWFVDQPPTVAGDSFWLAAFSMLSTERQFPGNGFGPIPWHCAFDFAARQGFGREMCNFFAIVIMTLDSLWRQHVIDEQEKEAKKEAKRAKHNKRMSDSKRGIGNRRRGRG